MINSTKSSSETARRAVSLRRLSLLRKLSVEAVLNAARRLRLTAGRSRLSEENLQLAAEYNQRQLLREPGINGRLKRPAPAAVHFISVWCMSGDDRAILMY